MNIFGKNKLTLKIVCTIFAVMMWFYVSYQENPTMSKTVKNVPLAITGEQALKENGFAVYKISDTSVDVKVTAKRTTLGKNSKKTLSAVINVSSINEEGEYELSPTVNAATSDATYYVKGKDIRVIVEPIVEKSIKIRADIAESPNPELIIKESRTIPEKVTVSAPKSIANDILEVRTEQIVPENDKVTEIKDVNLIAIGKNGKPLEWAECTPSSVDVKYSFYDVKTVPVVLKTSDGNTHSLSSDYTVKIYGSGEKFERIENVKTEVLNLSQYSPSDSVRVKLSLPESVYLASDVNEIEIKLSKNLFSK